MDPVETVQAGTPHPGRGFSIDPASALPEIDQLREENARLKTTLTSVQAELAQANASLAKYTMNLRTDGPTIEQFLADGYLAQDYPPVGYAPVQSPGWTAQLALRGQPIEQVKTVATGAIPFTGRIGGEVPAGSPVPAPAGSTYPTSGTGYPHGTVPAATQAGSMPVVPSAPRTVETSGPAFDDQGRRIE